MHNLSLKNTYFDKMEFDPYVQNFFRNYIKIVIFLGDKMHVFLHYVVYLTYLT